MAPLVGIMDLLVHLSLREGLPRALPQALAAAQVTPDFEYSKPRERLGRCGRQFVQPRFGVQRMVDDLHQLYLRLSAISA